MFRSHQEEMLQLEVTVQNRLRREADAKVRGLIPYGYSHQLECATANAITHRSLEQEAQRRLDRYRNF